MLSITSSFGALLPPRTFLVPIGGVHTRVRCCYTTITSRFLSAAFELWVITSTVSSRSVSRAITKAAIPSWIGICHRRSAEGRELLCHSTVLRSYALRTRYYFCESHSVKYRTSSQLSGGAALIDVQEIVWSTTLNIRMNSDHSTSY